LNRNGERQPNCLQVISERINKQILFPTFEDFPRFSAPKKLDLSFSNQRLDSTLVISNIRIRGRLDLFSSTLRLFLKSLDKDHFKRVPKPIEQWYASEPEGWFGLGPAQRKVKLDQVAHYLYELIVLFEKDDDIKRNEPYNEGLPVHYSCFSLHVILISQNNQITNHS